MIEVHMEKQRCEVFSKNRVYEVQQAILQDLNRLKSVILLRHVSACRSTG